MSLANAAEGFGAALVDRARLPMSTRAQALARKLAVIFASHVDRWNRVLLEDEQACACSIGDIRNIGQNTAPSAARIFPRGHTRTEQPLLVRSLVLDKPYSERRGPGHAIRLVSLVCHKTPSPRLSSWVTSLSNSPDGVLSVCWMS